jgi:hypothetical protein
MTWTWRIWRSWTEGDNIEASLPIVRHVGGLDDTWYDDLWVAV